MQKIIRLDLGGVNSYLIEKEGLYALVDTGGHLFMDKAYDDRLTALRQGLQENHVTPNNLKLLVLTHGDCDHVYNAAQVKKEFGVPIAMNKEDIELVKDPKTDCYQNNSKYSSVLFRLVFKMMSGKIEQLMKKVYHEFVSFEPDIFLEEGMNLAEYGFDATIYHTPGHTPGSICLLTKEGNLICGDLFANNQKPSLAPNAADFAMVKEQANRMCSLPVHTVFSGHGMPFEMAKAKCF